MIKSRGQNLAPSADYCFGRDELCANVLRSAKRNGAVLLFGGRQSGKTTLLLKLALGRRQHRASIHVMEEFDLGVYIDLMQLPYDATPKEFFGYLRYRLLSSCTSSIEGFEPPALDKQSSPRASLEQFTDELYAILDSTGEIDLQVNFLLDESKRVLGERFPRGFQDNLFALLYGSELGQAGRISMVFAGGAELYRLCEEDTSPIGSRAAKHLLRNLDLVSIEELLQTTTTQYDEDSNSKLSQVVFRRTGGQPGLSAKLASHLACDPTLDFPTADCRTMEDSGTLFRIWLLSLTSEARMIQDALLFEGDLSFRDVANRLEESGFDRYSADTVSDVLEFTGLARREGTTLSFVNNLYGDYARAFGASGKPFVPAPSDSTHYKESEQLSNLIWNRIMQVELALRALVFKKYQSQWADGSLDRMRKLLGEDSWKTIQQNNRRSEELYPYSPNREKRSILDSMYIGQLFTLMISSESWDLFRHLFRDKRQAQDMLASISPVRNDSAHFVPVPEKELQRCGIACDDLLVIIEKNEEAE